MATTNRAALLTKAHKVLKKHYSAPPASTRPLLEELLFACCLENARCESAQKAYATLGESFFDWNEVRVSSIRELASVLGALPEPEKVAEAVKKTLQGVFDKTYSFELEGLRKMAMGKAIKDLEGFGASPFALAHVTLTVLEGSAFPLDRGSIEALIVIGALNEAEVAKGSFGSIERGIPKNKRHEFAMLLHELGAELVANPYSTNLHKVLLEIAPDAKGRLPKRGKVEEPPKLPAKGAKGAKALPASGKVIPKDGATSKALTKEGVTSKALPPAKGGTDKSLPRAGAPVEKPSGKPGAKPAPKPPEKPHAEKPHAEKGKPIDDGKKSAGKKPTAKKPEEERKPAAKPAPAPKAKVASHKKKPGAARQKPR